MSDNVTRFKLTTPTHYMADDGFGECPFIVPTGTEVVKYTDYAALQQQLAHWKNHAEILEMQMIENEEAMSKQLEQAQESKKAFVEKANRFLDSTGEQRFSDGHTLLDRVELVCLDLQHAEARVRELEEKQDIIVPRLSELTDLRQALADRKAELDATKSRLHALDELVKRFVFNTKHDRKDALLQTLIDAEQALATTEEG